VRLVQRDSMCVVVANGKHCPIVTYRQTFVHIVVLDANRSDMATFDGSMLEQP
jgi:hypothetical protein